MALANIQSLKPKLDMLIHNMQFNNTDMCFVTETWMQHGNEPEYKYIKANLDTAGYNILIQGRENRKGGGLAVIYKLNLHVNDMSSFPEVMIALYQNIYIYICYMLIINV